MLTPFSEVEASLHLQPIADFFAIGKILKKKRLSGGITNLNYLFKTVRGEFVCKIFLKHPLLDLQQETIFLDYLHAEGFPIVLPLEAHNGEFFYVSKKICAALYPKIHGRIPQITQTTNYAIGKYLARLHLLPYHRLPSKKHWFSPDYLPKNLRLVQNHFPHFAKRFLGLYKKVRNFHPDDYPQSIVHGDLFRENVLFQGKRLLALLDWEEVGIGCTLLDFARSALGLCYKNGIFYPKLLQAFWDGYDSVKPVTYRHEDFKQALKYASLTRTTWVFLQFNLFRPSEEMRDRWKFYWEKDLKIFTEIDELFR